MATFCRTVSPYPCYRFAPPCNWKNGADACWKIAIDEPV
jgi:hypothetical protein